MKAYACAAMLAATVVFGASQAVGACPGAGGAPVVPNQTVANELVKFLLPQLMPGYGLQKAQATGSGAQWNVEAYLVLQGVAMGAGATKGAGGIPLPQKGTLEVRIDGCSGAVLSAQFKV